MKLRVKRLLAFIIDILPFIFFMMITAPIFNSDFYLFKIFAIKILFVIIYYVLLGLAVCTKDILFGYESIGKKLMKLKIVNQDGLEKKTRTFYLKRFFILSLLYIFHYILI